MSDMNTGNLLETLLASVATHLPTHEVHSDDDFALVPEGYRLEDLEGYHERPRRIEQRFKAETLDGFVAYYNRFATGDTAIFAEEEALSLEAVFNYHAPGQPAWGKHTASYALPKSPAWLAWTSSAGRKMKQRDFAEFVEEHEPDFNEPGGAAMLEIARELQAKKDVDFASRIDDFSGDARFRYETKTHVKGDLEVPRTFTLGLRPFRGGDAYEVTARMRFRIDDQKLFFWYELVRIDDILEEAFSRVLQKLSDKKDKGTLYRGARS